MNRLAILATAAASIFSFNTAQAMDGTGTLIDLNGKNIGSVALIETPSGTTRITISAAGLTQGWHGFHIHETGTCNPADSFKSAGGHLAGGKKHGVMNADGPHPGDMPNQMVQAGGILVAEVFNPKLNMTAEGDAAVFDDDGSSVMLHSEADDYTSQPSGSAENRIACAVIEKKK